MSEKRHGVRVEPDHPGKLAREKPARAVAELGRNALDADATGMDVDVERDDVATRAVPVSDGGRGLPPSDAEALFGRAGGPWKRHGARSKGRGRLLHGKEGKGRVKGRAPGRVAGWPVRNRVGGELLQVRVSVLRDDIADARVAGTGRGAAIAWHKAVAETDASRPIQSAKQAICRLLGMRRPPVAHRRPSGYPARMTPPLPPVRGTLTPGRPLSDLTWLRVGGPAEVLFQPADEADLAAFLRGLDPAIPVFPIGVGSNLIVRDGGLRGVVVRLGRAFAGVAVEGDRVTAGAAALDARVAQAAAAAGRDLTFLRTIPGTIGGAVRMNAGCYGAYVADVLEEVRLVSRAGGIVTLPAAALRLGYRTSDLPAGTVITAATFRAPPGDPAALAARMADQIARRDASQPVRDRSAGSTFRNPAGYSSTGRADDTQDLKAWKLIDAAGMRGATRGGAQMSPMHANFLVNTGAATAADLEGLGEEVRKRVFQHSGITLEWEIMRVGEPAPTNHE